MSSCIAIIPARGGSKGILRKNVRQVGGRPLISWTIGHAQAAKEVGRVIVTTDDDEIAAVAMEYGAEVFRRSPGTATDSASTESALIEVLEAQVQLPELTVLLQCTSPLRQPEDIDNAIAELRSSSSDSVFSGRYVEGYTWTYGCDLRPNYECRQPRQLQSAITIEENGSIYVFRSQQFLITGNRICGRVGCYEMSPLDSFQIDDMDDIATIEALMQVRHAGAAVA